MSTQDTEPALVRMGANTRDAPSKINLDVSGTVGPDVLGQETANVQGHPNDRPGVRSRAPEEGGADHPEVSRMDTGEELPVLLESDMRADPCEGVQGSFSEIIEGECARCGYDRLKHRSHTLAGEHQESCMACGAIQDGRAEDGYRMPKTREDRAKQKREAGPKLGSITSRDVIDLEPDTGYGPMVCLADSRGFCSLFKDDIEDVFWMLVENDDIDLEQSIRQNRRQLDRAVLASALLPAGLSICPSDEEAGTEQSDGADGDV